MNKVLIITQKLDPHTDAVIDELRKLNYEPLRLNSESLLSEYTFSLKYMNNKPDCIIEDLNNRKISLNSIKSCYCRKPIKVLPHPDIEEEGAKLFSSSEGQALLNYIYTYPNIRCINNPYDNKKVQLKFHQLERAKVFGLSVPKTLITNNPIEVKAFYKKCNFNVITKSLGTTMLNYGGEVLHTYSHKLTKEEQEAFLEYVYLAPTFFQEYIEKKIELRITVIGEKVFSCEIHSQEVDGAKIDWRAVEPWDIPHKIHHLPHDLEKKLINYINSYNLSFGAFDFILRPNGEYVFLELNPNGQWYWIEMMTKMPMAKAMAELLTK